MKIISVTLNEALKEKKYQFFNFVFFFLISLVSVHQGHIIKMLNLLKAEDQLF